MENKGHADGIKKSIEEIIGTDTIIRSKRPSEDNIQQEKFEKLITALRETLEGLTYDKLAEMEASKAEQMVKQLSYVPIPPKYSIGIF